MLIILCLSFISLFLDEVQSGNIKEAIEMRILKTGSNVSIECEACNVASRQWTYTSFNGSGMMEDLAKGNDIIRINYNEKGDFRYNVSTKDANCTYNLLITTIQLGDAGVFACWEGSKELNRTIIAVTNAHDMCSSEPEFPYSKDILLKQNDPVTIKCSFQYSADESCIVTPIWTDLTRYRNLTIPGDDFEVNMDDKHAWIHFKPGANVTNGTRFNLSFAFNCSFSNKTQDKHIRRQGRYDFGHVPFTIFVEASNTNQKLGYINLLLTIAISIAIAIITIAMVLLLAWIFYKLFHAAVNFQTSEDISILDKDLPDIPKMTEPSEIMEDFQLKDMAGFRLSEDVTYDIINDYVHDEPRLTCKM